MSQPRPDAQPDPIEGQQGGRLTPDFSSAEAHHPSSRYRGPVSGEQQLRTAQGGTQERAQSPILPAEGPRDRDYDEAREAPGQ